MGGGEEGVSTDILPLKISKEVEQKCHYWKKVTEVEEGGENTG